MNPGKFIKYFRGLEDRKDSRTNRLEADQIEKKLVELMNDGVFIAQEYKFIYANSALTGMLDYNQEEFIGTDFETVIAPEFLDIWLERYKKRVEHGPEPLGRYEVQFLLKNGFDRIWFELQARRIHYNGELAVLGVVRDISGYKKIQSELIELSRTDDLTGLANRCRLMDLLELAMQSADRRREMLAVLFMDLDCFKEVNDMLGHAAGDELLKQVTTRLRNSIRTIDIISRLGGDEFVIVLSEIKSYDDTKRVTDKILRQFQEPFWHEDRALDVSASIGISHYPADGKDCEVLLQNADMALYQVKKSGKSGYWIRGQNN